MRYPIINPPHSPPFAKMSNAELKDYYDWLLAAAHSTVQELAGRVSSAPGFESWKPDFSPQSLDMLGIWFAEQVHTRPRTQSEIAAIQKSSPYPVEVPKVELSDETFAIAFEVAMYLAQVFLHERPSLRWHHVLEGKGSIDYGQPVLTGFAKQQFNPVQVVITLAYGLVSGRKDASGLRKIHEAWSKLPASSRS